MIHNLYIHPSIEQLIRLTATMVATLSDIDVSDAEFIARYIDVPSMQNGPLCRAMFPQWDLNPEAQTEEIICWYTKMLEDALRDQLETFCKACSADGTVLGFCGWTVIQREVLNNQTIKLKPGGQRKNTWLPASLDVDAWISLSKALRTDRERVLKALDNICRKSYYTGRQLLSNCVQV